MPRRNRKARSRPRRRSVAHLFAFVSPEARKANSVYYALGSTPLEGSKPNRNGHFVRMFPLAPDTASSDKKIRVREIETGE